MDCLSGVQNQLVLFSTTKIKHNHISKHFIVSKNPILLAKIEGDFCILLNGEVFLKDENMCVLEMCVQLYEWLIRKGDFCYNAVSSEEKNILQFISINEKEYAVYSSWSKKKSFKIEKETLLNSIKSYIENTNEILNNVFGITISDFAK